MILDSHPNIACGPELKILGTVANHLDEMSRVYMPYLASTFGFSPNNLKESFAKQLGHLLEIYRKQVGKLRLAEMTPQNVHYFKHIHSMFEDSPLVHVIRDGRDVVSSLLRQIWVDLSTGEPVEYTQDVAKAAEYWALAVTDGRSFASCHPRARYHEIRYEDVVLDTESSLQSLFEFLGEPWDPVVLDFDQQPHHVAEADRSTHNGAQERPLYGSSIGRWKNELSHNDKNIVKDVAGTLLIELIPSLIDQNP